MNRLTPAAVRKALAAIYGKGQLRPDADAPERLNKKRANFIKLALYFSCSLPYLLSCRGAPAPLTRRMR